MTSNLALPGSGSLLAGRISGYPQLALALAGLTLTALFGAHFVFWNLANWSRLHGPEADPVTGLVETWRALRWPLLGIAVFAAGWLWALATSIQLVRSVKGGEAVNVPPLLNR